MASLKDTLRRLLADINVFSEHASGIRLRAYQRTVAQAVIQAVLSGEGGTFVVVFPRQSGKNELQAQIETYLLVFFSQSGAEMVKVSPTWKPQTQNAMHRLERVLEGNLLTRRRWKKAAGYIYALGRARLTFLSGSPTANVVGATASTLLECDEAQEVLTSKWDKDFAPMAASTNATRLFWGTAWTSQTLLARELRLARLAEQQDGRQRVFFLTANEVAAEVPAYGVFVNEQVTKLGRQHPLVKTQYFSEEIDAMGGMFTERRMALMRGNHDLLNAPLPGRIYAFLVDVAGEDESASDENSYSSLLLRNPGRDSTVLTIVEVDLSSLADELLRAPAYKVVQRYSWTGVKHTMLYGQLRSLTQTWAPAWLVIDATGVGAGLASFLDKAFPRRVIPFTFTRKSKSELGWGFLAVVETGRYKEPVCLPGKPCTESALPEGLPAAAQVSLPAQAGQTDQFWLQVSHCQSTILEGPEKVMQWGVPDGTRDEANGELVHDDLVLSAALCAELDKLEWSLASQPLLVKRKDPLVEMDSEGF